MKTDAWRLVVGRWAFAPLSIGVGCQEEVVLRPAELQKTALAGEPDHPRFNLSSLSQHFQSLTDTDNPEKTKQVIL